MRLYFNDRRTENFFDVLYMQICMKGRLIASGNDAPEKSCFGFESFLCNYLGYKNIHERLNAVRLKNESFYSPSNNFLQHELNNLNANDLSGSTMTKNACFPKFALNKSSSLLIDGDSLHSIEQRLRYNIDLEKLIDLLREQYFIPRLLYFQTIHPGVTEKLIGFYNWLEYRGVDVVSRHKTNRGHSSNGDADTTPIPVDIAMEAAYSANFCDHIILISRNRDLESIGTTLRLLHKSLTILCDSDCPSELRCSAMSFVDLGTLRNQILRS